MRHVVLGLSLLGVFVLFFFYLQLALCAALSVCLLTQDSGVVFYGTFTVAMIPTMKCCVDLTGAAVRRHRDARST